jgi:transcription elongation factor
MAVVSGKAAFAHLDSTEVYNGQDTGRYTLTVTLDDDNAEMLAQQGVKLKDYEGVKQRKFASKFAVKIIDANDQPFIGNIPRGSVVRLSYKTGTPHPVHGTPTYLNAVRVVEVAEDSSGIDADL